MSECTLSKWSLAGLENTFSEIVSGIEKKLTGAQASVSQRALAAAQGFLEHAAYGIELHMHRAKESDILLMDAVSTLTAFIKVYSELSAQYSAQIVSMLAVSKKLRLLNNVLDCVNTSEPIPLDHKSQFEEALFFYRVAEQKAASESYQRHYDTSADDSPCCA